LTLPREEYVEQAHFFRTLLERMTRNEPMQDVLAAAKEEVLATTRLPMAIDFMLDELKHHGVFAEAMRKLAHYFTPFQTYVVAEAESEILRFDLRTGLEILTREALYRAEEATPQGLFVYQFESVARNRLRYDQALDAMAADPAYSDDWKTWIRSVRRRLGMADVADLIYVCSDYYPVMQARQGREVQPPRLPYLFGEREGRIALANRRKDPMYLFSALHRHLGYPEVPRPKPMDESPRILEGLGRRMERVEQRLKLLEEEQKGGIDLNQFYSPQEKPQQERLD